MPRKKTPDAEPNKDKASQNGEAKGRTVQASQVTKARSLTKKQLDELRRRKIELKLEGLDPIERFEYLRTLVKMVGDRKINSLVVSGDPGAGKSHTVRTVLNSCGRKVIKVSGHSSPLAMYGVLHDNRDSLIVFDDCDSALEDHDSQNILKAALDSYDVRVISWLTTMKGFEYENYFTFKGQVIFITNKRFTQIDPAIVSRCMLVDVHMSKRQMLQSIKHDLHSIIPDDTEGAIECFKFLIKQSETIDYVNMRTLKKIYSIYLEGAKNWQGIAAYVILPG